MTEETALYVLLLSTLALSLILVLVSSAAFGRILSDIEYQQLTGINGVRRIQSRVNLRTHGNRIVLGLVFGTLAVLTMIEMPGIWRVWTGRGLLVLMLAGYAASSVLDWLAERAQLKHLLKERADTEGHPR